MNDDYLVHYGVVGMKWGVRRGHKYTSLSTRAHRNIKEYHANKAQRLSDRAKAKNNVRAKARLISKADQHSEKAQIQKTREQRSATHDKKIQEVARKQDSVGTAAGIVIAGGSVVKSYASLQASGMNKVQSLILGGVLGQFASAYQKSRYIRTGKDYAQRALEQRVS